VLEVVPFLIFAVFAVFVVFVVFALSGGLVPLPLTVLLILAIDLGTEPCPRSHRAANPPNPASWPLPRRHDQNVIDRSMLLHAWRLMS
jgi:hypothetical protein